MAKLLGVIILDGHFRFLSLLTLDVAREIAFVLQANNTQLASVAPLPLDSFLETSQGNVLLKAIHPILGTQLGILVVQLTAGDGNFL
jgi:hypothetical protein